MARTKTTARKSLGPRPNRDINAARKKNEDAQLAKAVEESQITLAAWLAYEATAAPLDADSPNILRTLK